MGAADAKAGTEDSRKKAKSAHAMDETETKDSPYMDNGQAKDTTMTEKGSSTDSPRLRDPPPSTPPFGTETIQAGSQDPTGG